MSFDLLEKWKRAVDSGQMFGAFLTDPSKAFVCLDYVIPVPKLNTYGFSLPLLKLVHNYLSYRKQTTKVNGTYNSRLNIFRRTTELHTWFIIVWHLLGRFALHLNNVGIASYAYNNTSCVIDDDINGVIASLEKTSKALFEWFENYLSKSHAGKCHLLVSSGESVI